MSRPHLELVLRRKGRAKLSGGGKVSEATKENERQRTHHRAALEREAAGVVQDWTREQEQRAQEGRPVLPSGIPVLLQVDQETDVDFLRTAFHFEVLCEQEDGFLLVATESVDLNEFHKVLSLFERSQRGGGSAAKLHHLLGQTDRLERVLSGELWKLWPTLNQTMECIVELSVECLGLLKLPPAPERNPDESDEKWNTRHDRHSSKCDETYQKWEQLREERANSLKKLVAHYKGTILGEWEANALESLPDSFSLRVRIHGDGLRDIVQNYQYLFEACLPDKVQQPANAEGRAINASAARLLPPAADAPRVCVIDSGLQEKHLWLEAAIDEAVSDCFIPGESSVADFVEPSGHGTRVASALLFPEKIPDTDCKAVCWLQNARVLDANCQLPDAAHPPATLRRVVTQYAEAGTRLFVHSINASVGSRRTYMSAWAAEIDWLCSTRNILFLQAAGNIPASSNNAHAPGVQEHLSKDRLYPDYLDRPSSRIANPAQSFHAVTVGSVARGCIEKGGWRTLASPGDASAFSRCGPGLWGIIKPDVVEYAGDYAVSESLPLQVGHPPAISEALPLLLRSTLHEPGPAFARDTCGTSFATPKVAHTAARIAVELPQESVLTHRALLINSARWPQDALNIEPEARGRLLRRIGYGVPTPERGAHSEPHRVTLYVPGNSSVQPREAQVYQVRLPDSLRSIVASHRVLVEVTLAYSAQPRRTRRGHRFYLSTWLDWRTSKLDEAPEAFLARILKDEEYEGPDTSGLFQWAIGRQTNQGIPNVRRNAGTVQKDWAVVSGDQLPREFCIAVIGHPGWDSRPNASAPYGLCITFEVLDEEIDVDIHAEIAVAVEALKVGEITVQQ